MGFWAARDAGAGPERSENVQAGVISRLKTPKRDVGSAVKTKEQRGVGDHVR